jgi:DNA-binding response OmpR family regulator
MDLRARLARLLSRAGYSLEIAESSAHARRLGRKRIALTIVASADPEAERSTLVDSLRTTTSKAVLVVVGSGSLLKVIPEAVDASDETEILARVNDALAPTVKADEAATVLLFVNYRLDLAGQSLVTESGKEILLTHLEYRLLNEFVRQPGRVLSRDELLQALSGREAEAYDRSIDVLVGRHVGRSSQTLSTQI